MNLPSRLCYCVNINRCDKLPRAVKDWPTYCELRELIDKLIAMVPLLDQMHNNAMSSRHWQEIQQMTGSTLDSDGVSFSLGNVMDASPLDYKEQIEVQH